jgi:hypothetical protein
MNALQTRLWHNSFVPPTRNPLVRCGESSSEQKDQNNDHQYQAKAPAVVMVWRTSIEATAAEKENQND